MQLLRAVADAMLLDVRHLARSLRGSPGFAVVAIGAARAFEGITYVRGDGLRLRVGDDTRDVGVAFVSPGFFP